MSQGENPYVAQNDPPLPGYGAMPAPSMDYVGAYSFIFQSPAWLPNLFFTMLALLIPVIGHIIALGYQFEIVEALIRDPRRVYPDYDWNKFTQYLTRGVWPFLISLIVGLVVGPIFVIIAFGMFVVIGLLTGGANDTLTVAGTIAMFGVGGVMFIAMLLLQLIIAGFQLRAGLSQDFGTSFNFSWVRDYIARMWVELLLSMLFLMITSWFLLLGGLLLFCVGMYVAMAWVTLAQTHFHFQIYRLYLARGGMEIPLKSLPPMAPGIPR